MTHTLIVTVVVLLVYGSAAVAVLVIYRASDDAAVSAGNDRLGRAEADAARRVFAGELDPAAYRRTMAALAARDAAEHPLITPGPPRQDEGPAGR
ncbi:hypothetical protein [Dactylosporangium sp. NPDC005555]|uniref:hypothetical protein n=1 Tax=Dactylosporangium sp. NPDC005555 TaxID=3154889 RepID=UPI0033AF15BD